MSLTGQIIREKLAVATLHGFFLTMRWRYDSGLPIIDKILELEDIHLLELAEVVGDLVNFFPSTIPGGTEFLTPTGGIFTTEKLAYIKDYDTLNNAGIDSTPDEQVLVWSCTARYSYLKENDTLDEESPPSYTPWQYPGEDDDYVPVGMWPDQNFDYARWQGIAQHYLTFTAEAPWGVFLRPDTSDGYDLINFNAQGGAQVVDWTTYQTIEGREPLKTFTNNLDAAGISWRQTTQAGTRYIEAWLRPSPPDQTDEGFFRPREEMVLSPHVQRIVAADIFGFPRMLGFTWNSFSFPSLSPRREVARLLATSSTEILGTEEGALGGTL